MGSSAQKAGGIVTRRNFLKAAGVAVIGLPLYAGEISRHELWTERREIHLPRLPDAFRGFRIAQISDLHYGDFTEPFFIREAVRRVNSLNPDLVVITGDYITVSSWSWRYIPVWVERCAALLTEIECPVRYGVLGNHDAEWNAKQVSAALTGHGIPVLHNRYVPLERDGKRLWLGGTGDALFRQMDLDTAVPPTSVSGDEPVILLVHEPDVLPQVARCNVDLMISGHTHGGQVRLPFFPPLSLPPLGEKYVEGLFRMGSTQLYVNRGIGTVGVPFRFDCPPEVTLFTLV
jgi:predicted MPP superfamily phosphohydrolase